MRNRRFSELVRARIAMENSSHTAGAGFGDHGAGVVFSVARMHDHRLARITRESELFGKCASLLESRRVVVVIIEPALSHSHCSLVEQLAKLIDIACRIESARVVRMNPRSVKNKSVVLGSDGCRCASGAEDIPGAASGADADYCTRSICTCSFDYRAAVAVERRVGEVRVAVDVPREIPIFLGHFLSIQRSVGPAI